MARLEWVRRDVFQWAPVKTYMRGGEALHTLTCNHAFCTSCYVIGYFLTRWCKTSTELNFWEFKFYDSAVLHWMIREQARFFRGFSEVLRSFQMVISGVFKPTPKTDFSPILQAPTAPSEQRSSTEYCRVWVLSYRCRYGLWKPHSERCRLSLLALYPVRIVHRDFHEWKNPWKEKGII